jgi:hypothetical protein
MLSNAPSCASRVIVRLFENGSGGDGLNLDLSSYLDSGSMREQGVIHVGKGRRLWSMQTLSRLIKSEESRCAGDWS